jgi:hypothetical protein
MAMVINAATAAYGLFQIVFATLDSRLSRTLVALCRCKSDRLTFAVLSRMTFGRRLGMLRTAIGAVKQGCPDDPEIGELVEACNLAQRVQSWRNSRIHGEVRFVENQAVLVDSTGQPLETDREACEERIREAIKAGIAIETGVRHLVAYEMDLEELNID